MEHLMTPAEVIELMESSSSEADWDNNCDLVKRVGGGNYPSFWWPLVILSGLAERVENRWKGKGG